MVNYLGRGLERAVWWCWEWDEGTCKSGRNGKNPKIERVNEK